jgi:hypothetical protein
MAEDSNGHGSPSRMDRIERAIGAQIDGHERLLASQKQLLTAQVVMMDTVTILGKRVDDLKAAPAIKLNRAPTKVSTF